jgi:hypothetical protein
MLTHVLVLSDLRLVAKTLAGEMPVHHWTEKIAVSRSHTPVITRC